MPSRRQAHTVGSNVINPYADLVEAYGSATVLCFPDMDGVLADAVLSPKQIYLPKSGPGPDAQVLITHVMQHNNRCGQNGKICKWMVCLVATLSAG